MNAGRGRGSNGPGGEHGPPACRLACGAALLACVGLPAHGAIAVVASTGNTPPGIPGTTYAGFLGTPRINASGQVAYVALLSGAGISASNDATLWRDSTLIAREASPAPGLSGVSFGSFSTHLQINAAGRVAFWSPLSGSDVSTGNDEAIWRDATIVTREGNPAPGLAGVTFGALSSIPVLNGAGQVAYLAALGGAGITAGNDTSIWRDGTLLVREGNAAPGLSGVTYGNLFTPQLNAAGQIAYLSALAGTGVGPTNASALWRDGTLVAREGNPAPGLSGVSFGAFSSTPQINGLGQIAFASVLTGTGVTAATNTAIWRDTTLVARAGNTAPGLGGIVYGNLATNTLRINDGGQVAYSSELSGSEVLSTNDEAIWRSGTLIVREGNAAAGLAGLTHASLDADLALNESGVVAFSGLLTGSGVGTGNDRAIWLGDGTESRLVVREGNALAGTTISNLNAGEFTLNDFGQVAFRADLATGGSAVCVFTPDLRWRSATGGAWTSTGAWTLGLAPALVHDVRIDPAANLTVTGPPAATTVHSLAIGGGAGTATLSLLGGILTASQGATIHATGVLTGDGTIAGGVFNGGTVRAQNVTVQGGLTNAGTVSGDGRIAANLVNTAGGQVRVEGGARLRLSAVSGGHSNAGLVHVSGAEFEVDGALANQTAGSIVLGTAIVRFNGGLTNAGLLRIASGQASVFGTVTNLAGGLMLLEGNSNTSFYDRVVNGGELRIAAGSTAVFFGDVSGAGSYTGAGNKLYEAAFSPGASPALVLDAGSSRFGPGSVMEIELGGGTPGFEHDRYVVAGTLDLAGALSIVLIGGFSPRAGDAFDVLDWGTLEGGFSHIDTSRAPLSSGLAWSFADLYATGEIHVIAVPEPGTWALLLAGLGLIGSALRRRSTSRASRPN